jgi:hypothetical protein
VEFEELLNVPGMGMLLRGAPVFGGALWLWLLFLLWKDGFGDLYQQLTRPPWKGTNRTHTAIMIPLRALMLAGAAALGAAMTTLGLLFNIAVILNIVNAASGLLGK